MVKNYIIKYKEAHGETSEVFFQALSAREAVRYFGIEPSSVVQILEVSEDYQTTYDVTEFL